MLSPQKLFRKNCLKTHLSLQAFFSRRSDNNSNDDVYKLVRSRNFDDMNNSYLGGSPNWELLAPKGYRFYMPGSIGPAWHDESTIALVEQCFPNKKLSSKKNISFDYSAEECPILLREGVLELFQGLKASTHITVVTIHQKYPGSHQYSQDFDELAKRFVLAAQVVCNRLQEEGYWADFINPFSGRPYHTPLHGVTLYKTDERFRCLGFMIKKHAQCKVISPDPNEKKTFVGSLFTSVPADSPLLQEIFKFNKG